MKAERERLQPDTKMRQKLDRQHVSISSVLQPDTGHHHPEDDDDDDDDVDGGSDGGPEFQSAVKRCTDTQTTDEFNCYQRI